MSGTLENIPARLMAGLAVAWLTAAGAHGQGFDIGPYEVVSSNRVNRTVWDFVLRFAVTNRYPAAEGVTGTVVSTASNVTQVVQGAALFGNLAPGGQAMSANAVTIRHDRLVPFDPSVLRWSFRVERMALAVTLDSPASGFLTNGTNVQVAGTVGPGVTAVLIGGQQVTNFPDGTNFSAQVSLREGRNTLTALATNEVGGVGSASAIVNRDTTPPLLNIETPGPGAVLAGRQVNVTGMINDVVPGTVNPEQAQVMINGLPAMVLNRSYAITDLLLAPGRNTIQVVARDRAGNESQRSLEVTVMEAALQKRLNKLAGDMQSGTIGSTLAEPLVVELVDANGVVQTNQPVTFSICRNDGLLFAPPSSGRSFTLLTDYRGQAQVLFQLGTRTGAGNNQVDVNSPGALGQVIFCANATGAPPHRISALLPETQIGETGRPLPQPWTAYVTDPGGNPVAGVPVTFMVFQGDGGTVNGSAMFTTNSDTDGRASVLHTLGPQEGVNNNVVIALAAGVTNSAATFTASARAAARVELTRVVGLVLDNANRPMSNILCRIEENHAEALTDAQGQFVISNAPVGSIHLFVDARDRGYPGVWHALEFMLDTVAGRDNSVDRPIYMLPLDDEGSAIAGGAEAVTLRMKGIPGAEMTIFPHSVRDASGQPVTNRVLFTQVNMERVPMPPPLGSQFMLAWTVQPSGLHFDPPARMCIPNMGAPPGQVVEMFSFDHDLIQFVAIGTATVTADGAQMCSDPGFGVTKSGWGGCVPPPPPPTCVGGCDDGNPCTTDQCVNGRCVHTPKADGTRCDDGSGCSVRVCMGGSCVTMTQMADGMPCDDMDWCTENDRCQNGDCKGDKKQDEIVPPAIKFDVKLDNDPAAVAVKNFLQKLGIVKKVEAKFSVNGVRKRICCSDKMMLVENKSLSVAGELEIEIKETQLFGPRLPLPAPFDTGIGLWFKAKIQGAVSATPLVYDNCKEQWQGGGGGGIGVSADLIIRIKISEIVKFSPLAVTTGFSATCTITGSDQVRSKCTGNFNGLVLKSEFEFFNKKITLLDYVLIQPSSVGPFETVMTFLE